MLLIQLSGHSGSGKSRLLEALLKKNVDYIRAILYTSRKAREGERHGKDYFFSSTKDIEAFPGDRYLTDEIHGMKQAVDLDTLEKELTCGRTVIVNIFHSFWPNLRAVMSRRLPCELRTASVFLTAVDPELLTGRSEDDAAKIIKSEVRRILKWRGRDSEGSISTRCEAAVNEVLNAVKGDDEYDLIIHSAPEGPDGMDDWTRSSLPCGRAAITIDSLVSFLEQEEG